MYGEEVPGKVKYYNAGLFVIMGAMYWTTFRVFALYYLMHIDLVFWEIFPYAGIVFLLSYLFWIGPLQKRDKAQTRASGIDFMDSLVQKGKAKPQDLMLGFDDVYEMDINFDDDTSLKKRLKSETYQRYLRVLILKQIETNEKKHIETPEELIAIFDDLNQSIKQIEDTSKSNALESKDQIALDQEALAKDSKRFEEETRAIILSQPSKDSSKDLKIIGFEEFNIDAMYKKTEFNKSIEFLKTQKFCYVKLYAKESFEKEKEEWDELVIILPEPYSKVLATHKEKSELDGWPVNIKLCFCFWTYWWPITKEFPVLILNFSDNMTKANLDVFTNMCAEAMAYLELKVMDLWMNDLIVRPEYIIKENIFLSSKSETFEKGFSDLIQDQADMDIKYSQFLRDKTQSHLLKKIEKYKRGIIILLCSLLFAIIVGGIVISILI